MNLLSNSNTNANMDTNFNTNINGNLGVMQTTWNTLLSSTGSFDFMKLPNNLSPDANADNTTFYNKGYVNVYEHNSTIKTIQPGDALYFYQYILLVVKMVRE